MKDLSCHQYFINTLPLACNDVMSNTLSPAWFQYTDRTNPMDQHVTKMLELEELTAGPVAAQMFGNAGRKHMSKYGKKPLFPYHIPFHHFRSISQEAIFFSFLFITDEYTTPPPSPLSFIADDAPTHQLFRVFSSCRMKEWVSCRHWLTDSVGLEEVQLHILYYI